MRPIHSSADSGDVQLPQPLLLGQSIRSRLLAETDADRIGIWGSSYNGGHVLVVGAIDRGVKCVAGQVPLISGHNNARRLIRADFLGRLASLVRRRSAQSR
jgi:cephalosporin-C deacetylase-like acetyl esterase